MVDEPKVLGLLEAIAKELIILRDRISESDPQLVGVFDRLLTLIEVQKSELRKKRFSLERLSSAARFIVDLVEIISRWNNTLYCASSRFVATIYRYRWNNVGWQEY